jgi:hypothetical protein
MRRPVMYLAGLLVATGASLALAGPAMAASAAPSRHHCHHHNHSDWWNNDNDGFSYDYNYRSDNEQNNGSDYNGIVLLSGISNNGTGNGGLLGFL